MNRKVKYIFITIITILLVLLLGYGIVAWAESTSFGASVENYPTEPAYGIVQKKIVKEYKYRAPSYTKITQFPINGVVFNSNADFFCAQHHTPYASSARPTTLGSSGGDFHLYYEVTKHKVKSGYTSEPDGDIDTSADIYLDENGNTVWNLKEPYNGFMEKDLEDPPTNRIFTNWVYIPKDQQFDCEDKRANIGTKIGDSPIKDGGIAFILACYRGRNGSYSADPRQHAVWDWLGQMGSSGLRPAAIAFQTYHEDSKEPDVDTLPQDDVGTVLSGNTYEVGPFKMSNYVRAQNYSYSIGGKVTISHGDGDDLTDVDIDIPVENGINLQDIMNKATSNGSESDKDLRGTIIQIKAVVANEAGDTKEIPLDDSQIPDPNEVYNITLNDAEIQGYDELLDIIFVYQRVHSCGAGTWYDGRQKALDYPDGKNKQQCHGYHCISGIGSGGCSLSKSPGSTGSPYKGTCTHTWYTGCRNETRTGTRPNGSTYTYTVHIHGTFHRQSHQGDGAAVYTYVCDHGHGHGNCWSFEWQKPTDTGDYAQDGFAGDGLLTTEQIEYKVRVKVPLKTQMSIYKYITKVDHVGEDINLWDLGTQRREMTMQEKYDDAVPVERGDLVTYKIELVNDSRFPTRVKVKDLLPENCEPVYVNLVDCTLEEMPDEIKYSQWITIEGHSKNEYEIKVRPIRDSGKYTNIIEFITRNDTDEKMQYATWGSDGDGIGSATHGPHTNGNLVNTRKEGDQDLTTDLKEKDSDTYVIKEYNVSIEKYIYDVEHQPDFLSAGDNLDTTLSATDERSVVAGTTEEYKEANPVYVEYGDVVTYKIIVYNTTDNTGAPFDIASRKDEPYWEPDKVYVNVEDTLPQKFSNLEITVEDKALPGNDAYVIDKIDESVSGGKFTIKDLMVPPGETRIVTVKLTVEEHIRGTIEENNVKFIDEMKNINRGPEKGSTVEDKYCVIKNNSENLESSDWYILNDYNAFIDKYVHIYKEEMQKENNTNGYSNGGFITNDDGTLKTSRERKSDGEKRERPVSVEKYETLVYAIKVTNEAEGTESATASGDKYATQVRPTKVTDYMQLGLIQEGLEAKLYNADGTEKRDVDVTSSGPSVDGKYNVYEYTIGNETILNPGEFIVYYVTAGVTQSNMYLYDLENKAELTILTNINNTDEVPREVKNDDYNENISEQQESSEFVRMKDLVLAGNVWLDINRDGYMNDKARSGESNLEYYTFDDKEYYKVNDDAMKVDGITIKLYRVDGSSEKLIRTTITDNEGKYVFGQENGSWRQEDYNHDSPEILGGSYDTGESTNTKYQRIDKATTKDGHGNYTAGSRYIEYYIEFEYDGVLYKSTEFYSGTDNIVVEENSDFGKYDRNRPYGELNPPSTELHQLFKNSNPYLYEIDSNAAEFRDVREEFNKKYEYISYNSSYSDPDGSNLTNDMEYYKTGHVSQLKEDEKRTMTARSFIKNPTIGEDPSIVEKDWYDEVFKTRSLENTDLLWICKKSEPGDAFEPDTEYLKHINLGLELREDVDIALTKDVYKVKTTIDGEEMEYDFNKNTVLNGDLGKDKKDGYLSDFIIAAPYGLELYESDYKYRFDQYKSQAVREYKGINGESELNVEITYRITVENKSVSDDDTVKEEGKEPPVKDTKLYVRVNEVLDLYDENFLDYDYSDGKRYKDGKVTVKGKDENGYLVDKELAITEAWYFKKAEEASGLELVDDKKYIIENSINAEMGTEKPIYKEDEKGQYVKVKLNISRDQKFSKKKDNNFTADGYKTLYLTGMENEVIAEGEHLDIYVKYTVDNTKALEIDVTNESYEETTTKTEEKRVDSLTVEKNTITVKTDSIKITSEKKATIERALKLAERITTEFKQKYGRGTENIAQVHTFSVWYDEKAEKYPASLVDMDSNPGNIGIKDEGTTSADDIDYYEDTAYKTGIELVADGTENTREKVEEKYKNIGIEIIIRTVEEIRENLIRSISGKVWDDSRSSAIGEGGNTQYVGNGYNKEEDTRDPEAKRNESVTENYKDKDVTEDKDIDVRSAKVEIIEIVEVPQSDGSKHYYEEILSNVTWDQVQHMRTRDDGTYELTGFIPGTYIVRFTYGDTIEENQVKTMNGLTKLTNTGEGYDPNLEAQRDMLIFNGQDYKSTQYTLWDGEDGKSDIEGDAEKDPDTIIRQLEKADRSDARDDEVRRLEANAFSEIMTNGIAEVLKGVANGTDLAKRAEANTAKELKILTDNTYMNAETMEFLVKAEKLTDKQTNEYITVVRKNIDIGNGSYNLSDAKKLYDDIYYKELEKIQNKDTVSREFKIENVDFGIEYRPESQISLTKEIDEIKIVTEDGNTLVDLFFYTTGSGTPEEQVHHIDLEKSKGMDLVQFITNDYKGILEPILSTGEIQGFVYIQVDDDILQGSKIEITYKFEAQNESEVDRITTNLNAIRYKENKLTQDLILDYGNDIIEKNYTASVTARNMAYKDMFARDEKDGSLYRKMKKTIVENNVASGSEESKPTVSMIKETASKGYFGRFVGYAYYTGEVTGLDTVSSLKFDKILDYVDTDLEYEQQTNNSNLKDKLWAKTTVPELIDYVYLLREARETSVVSHLDKTTTEIVRGITDGGVSAGATTNIADKLFELKGDLKLTNVGNIEYTDLVVSVDDRVVDEGDPNDNSSKAPVNNTDLSRFLLPKVTIDESTLSEEQIAHEKGTAAMGIVYLPVSKVISAETDTDNMSYENIAEVIQFTTLTGRRTNFATTVGNVQTKNPRPDDRDPDPDHPTSGSEEFVEASYEPDTDSTETITLTPPTGLMRNRRKIVNAVETAKTGVGVFITVGIVVALVIITAKVIITIRKKKRYK